MGKASTRAQNRYIAKAYDRINLTVPKGKKDTLQEHAQAMGESVNGFINRAITEAMERDGGGVSASAGGIQEAAGPGMVTLSSILKANEEAIVIPVVCGTRIEWEDAASIANLPFTEFIVNAVEKAVDEAVSPELCEVVSLSQGALKAAQEAAEFTGETVSVFLERAAEAQAERDQRTRGMADKVAGVKRSRKGGKPNE